MEYKKVAEQIVIVERGVWMNHLTLDHEWHVAINNFNDISKPDNFCFWMYEAKRMYHELPRLTELFKQERIGTLPKLHQQCSLSDVEKIEDNCLTCCQGSRNIDTSEGYILTKGDIMFWQNVYESLSQA